MPRIVAIHRFVGYNHPMKKTSKMNGLAFCLSILLQAVWSPFGASAQTVSVNDTFFEKQWYLSTIQAPEAWKYTTGTADVVVAVIDSGVDIDHPDLRQNIWNNPLEIPNNQKDDDQNGFIDDIHGWNFVEQNADVRPLVSKNGIDEAFIHGTVVASLIGARGNDGIGIAGVAGNSRIMPLVVLNAEGEGNDVDIAQAIRYAVAQGADIINLSFVGYEKDQLLGAAIDEATSQGVLIVSAAGNGETILGEDLDKVAGFPACNKGAGGKGSISVTSINQSGKKADYANWGTCVDIAAPGEQLYAARPTYSHSDRSVSAPGYRGNLTGTSVAAPLVAGVAALIKSAHPDWTAEDIADRIRQTATPLQETRSEFIGKTGAGIVNAFAATSQSDAEKKMRGPFFLEGSIGQKRSSVRIISGTGEAIQYLDLGVTTHTSVRAGFLHWHVGSLPDIAITFADDKSGAWKIFRWDGVLLAAGVVGDGDLKGGLVLAAQDLDADGKDEVLLLEAKGSRMWLLSSKEPHPMPIQVFANPVTQGSSAVSITRPRAGFLVASRGSDRQVTVIGRGGSILAQGPVSSQGKMGGWSLRRASRKGSGSVYELQAKDGKLILVNDGSGLTPTMTSIPVKRWNQIPDGQSVHVGWLYYESWPR